MLISGTLLQNRYRIVQPLGSGGQGAVYLALHLGLNAYVAIKESFSNDPVANAQFQTEANLLAHLSHPNLPRVTDFFIEPNGARYLVMEYVQGENLETIVQQRGAPIPESEALNWFRQIFDAVKYLHVNHVIHRDIKPQNIIITPQHRAVLVDFGIAKVMASGALTGASMRFGSPGYAPPEQYSGGTDERSDIYSLGATLYFALTGQTPPEAPMRASGVKVIPPRQLNAGISVNVERAVLKAMSLDAGIRYVLVGAFYQELGSNTVSSPTLPSSPRKSNQFIWIGISFTVLVGLFAFGSICVFADTFSALLIMPPPALTRTYIPTSAKIAHAATETHTRIISPTSIFQSDTPAIIRTPLRSHTPTPGSTATQLPSLIPSRTRPIPTNLPTPSPTFVTKKIGIGNVGNIRELSSLHGHSDFINGIDFSPDSSLLVSGSWDSTVRLWNVRTGEQITSFAARGGTTDVHFVAKGEQIAASNYVQPEKGVHDFWFQIWGVKSTQEVASFQGPAWEKAISTARNGSLIAVGGNEIRLLSPPSFQTIKEWEPGTFGVNDVAFHPDGQFLAAVGAGDTVEIWDIEGNLVSSFEGPAGPRIASVSFSRDGTLLAAGSVNGQVRIWRTSNFQLINTLATGDANSLAFSVDNSLLAVGGAREVQLWSVSTGELVVNLSGFTHSIQTLTFSPNGDYLATAGEPIIKLWGIPEP